MERFGIVDVKAEAAAKAEAEVSYLTPTLTLAPTLVCLFLVFFGRVATLWRRPYVPPYRCLAVR